MKITATALPGVLILEPKMFRDARGFFLESYNERVVAEAGIRERFVQDNHSFSVHNVLRGLHYQVRPQGKLVRVIVGEILDVAVDLRRSSPTFGSWYSLSSRRRATNCCGSPGVGAWFSGIVGGCSRSLQSHRFL